MAVIGKSLGFFAFCNCWVPSVEMRTDGSWQVGYLGRFTSFSPMAIEFAYERLAPSHQSYNTSRLKKQECNDQETINKGIQITLDKPPELLPTGRREN